MYFLITNIGFYYMKKYRKSNYLIYEQNEKMEYILYNSLNGIVIKMKEKEYIDFFKKILKNEELEEEDTEIFKLFVDNKYLVETNYNELLSAKFVYQENIIKDETLHLMLILTRNCNFKCVYCGQEHKEDEKLNEGKLKIILKSIENLIKVKSYKNIHISFFGGEPMMEYNLILFFLKDIKNVADKYNLSYSASVTTNGYLLTKNRMEMLCKYNCNFFQITIDGMNYTHDKTRILTNNGKTWKVIIENIKDCIKLNSNFKILLRTNYNYDIIDSILEFYDYVYNNLNDSRISFYYENIKNHGNENTPELISNNESIFVNIELSKIMKKYKFISNNTSERLKPCGIICNASNPNFFIIDYNLEIKKCTNILDKRENIIGYISNTGTLNISKEEYCKWVYYDYEFSQKCLSCKVLPLCFGKRCPKNFAVNPNFCENELIIKEIKGILKQM